MSKSTRKTGLNSTAAIILAAGKGKRMRSSLPKVLHRLLGRPLVCWVVEAAQKAGIKKIIVVIGFKGELVKKALREYIAERPERSRGIEFVWQKSQLGTGHAVRMAYPKLKNFRGTLLVLAGDVPAIKPQTIRKFLEYHKRQKAFATVLTARWPNPTGYGRILRSKTGDVLRIVEHKDATLEERKIREVNTGTLVFRVPPFFKLLSQIKNQNTQKEYYLTDVITVLNRQKKKVAALLLKNLIEAQGVNSREELEKLEKLFREENMTFSNGVKTHLGEYKVEHLKVLEKGIHTKTNKAYAHILPKGLKKLNIIKTYRDDFWQYWKDHREITLHDGFHHLNSSQAMCFNLFFPLIKEKAFGILSDAFSIRIDENSEFQFEKIMSGEEGTNFDFYIKSDSDEMFFEVKYSENSFGPARDDVRHREKFEFLYKKILVGKVRSEVLDDRKLFFKHYQLLRNVSYIEGNRRLAMIFPNANTSIRDYVDKALNEIVSPSIREQITVLPLEELMVRITEKIPESNYRLKNHYKLFKEKYLFQFSPEVSVPGVL